MGKYKNIRALTITNALLLIGAILAYINTQHEVTFVALLVFLISLLPHYLKNVHNVHIPIIFVYGSIVFIFASVILGQFNKFYEKFHWYDAFLHFISANVFGIVGFLIIYVFYVTNRLRIPHLLIILFAFSFALMIGTMWEIIEFIIDRSVGTSLQANSLEDTMVDLILDAIGAIPTLFIGYLYLKKIPIPAIETAVDNLARETVDANKIVVEEVCNDIPDDSGSARLRS